MNTPEETQDNFYYIDVSDFIYGPSRMKGTKEQIALARELLKCGKWVTEIVKETGVSMVSPYYTITRESILQEEERLRDKASHDEAQALHHARQEGRIEGISERNIEFARALIADGVPVSKIMDYTGLTLKDIEVLQS